MTIKAMRFTPQVLISAPRRSAGVPNTAGTHVLYTTSTYSFETHSKTSELRVLDIKTNESTQLAKDEISDINWLNDDEFVCLQSEKDETTSIYWGSVSMCLEKLELGKSHYVAGTVAAPAGNLKVAKLSDGGYAFVVSALANPDGTLFQPSKAEKTQSTGRLYSSLYVRHWDAYTEKQKSTLWYGKLSKGDGGKYGISKLTNALKGTNLESPVLPFGGTDNFDISITGIVFVSKDPDLDPAVNTKSNVYLIRMASWTSGETPEPLQFTVKDFGGSSSSPAFTPDGKRVVFLSMKRAGYESDYNTLWVASNLEGPKFEIKQLGGEVGAQASWFNRSPSSAAWTLDSKHGLLTAEDEGNTKLFVVEPGKRPRAVTAHGSVSDFRPLASGKVFVSGSSLVENSFYSIIDPSDTPSEVWNNFNTGNGIKLGLKHEQVSSIWTPASNPKINKEIHAWVVKPSNFDSSKKYPVAYLIHGGPQGSWGDSWSTRWNPAVFAEQGFIVVAPNVTGSTGYGQPFTDAINRNWGGDPYQDIVNCFDWVGNNMKEADNKKAVALGASYGGYMMNWIQGHDLGRKFKALVCHDGIFSNANMLSTEELYFPFFDLGGTPWYDPGFDKPSQAQRTPTRTPFNACTFSDWRRWDPSEHLDNWATPQLVIHNSKDYRIAISEGLAAFNVLQARGVDSQFLTFPDENHFVLKPENSLVWHKTVLNWIRKYVGMSPFADEDPDGEDYLGGVREEKEVVVEMALNQGKPET